MGKFLILLSLGIAIIVALYVPGRFAFAKLSDVYSTTHYSCTDTLSIEYGKRTFVGISGPRLSAPSNGAGKISLLSVSTAAYPVAKLLKNKEVVGETIIQYGFYGERNGLPLERTPHSLYILTTDDVRDMDFISTTSLAYVGIYAHQNALLSHDELKTFGNCLESKKTEIESVFNAYTTAGTSRVLGWVAVVSEENRKFNPADGAGNPAVAFNCNQYPSQSSTFDVPGRGLKTITHGAKVVLENGQQLIVLKVPELDSDDEWILNWDGTISDMNGNRNLQGILYIAACETKEGVSLQKYLENIGNSTYVLTKQGFIQKSFQFPTSRSHSPSNFAPKYSDVDTAIRLENDSEELTSTRSLSSLTYTRSINAIDPQVKRFGVFFNYLSEPLCDSVTTTDSFQVETGDSHIYRADCGGGFDHMYSTPGTYKARYLKNGEEIAKKSIVIQ